MVSHHKMVSPQNGDTLGGPPSTSDATGLNRNSVVWEFKLLGLGIGGSTAPPSDKKFCFFFCKKQLQEATTRIQYKPKMTSTTKSLRFISRLNRKNQSPSALFFTLTCFH